MSTAKVLHCSAVSMPDAPFRKSPQRPALTLLAILAADIFTFTLVLFLTAGRIALHGQDRHRILHLWPLLPLFLVAYCFFDLFPAIFVSPIDEIKNVCVGISAISVVLFLILVSHEQPLRAILSCLVVWSVASVVMPAMRSAVRRMGSRYAWWGYPVALVGDGERVLSVASKLQRQPQLGLRPVAIVSSRLIDAHDYSVPLAERQAVEQLMALGVTHAIIAAPELRESDFVELLERARCMFRHLIVIPNSDFIWRSGSYTRDLMGTLGLHVRNDLLSAHSRFAKRSGDILLSLLLMALLAPMLAMISVAILLESGFPVFYSQERVGRGGNRFRIWKFRTMVRNADNALLTFLEHRPDLHKEWRETQKLRNDPRVTRVGRLLRRTSLDELPQIWNVLRGEMSIVGPRAIVEAEVARYHNSFSIYTRTNPGITGLWQVSGRNNTTYSERVAYDTFYVRNWSLWLDIYIMARTVGVILTGHGAY